MFCTKCGMAITEVDAYCSRCGVATGIPTTVMPARLMRSAYDKKIAGVCGGLGQHIGVDPTLVRLMWLVCTIAWPPLLIGYLVAWIVVPREPLRVEGAASATLA